jgi:hypothetical protein
LLEEWLQVHIISEVLQQLSNACCHVAASCCRRRLRSTSWQNLHAACMNQGRFPMLVYVPISCVLAEQLSSHAAQWQHFD